MRCTVWYSAWGLFLLLVATPGLGEDTPTPAVASQPANTIESIEKQVELAWGKLKSLSVSLRADLTSVTRDRLVEVDGVIEMLRHEGREYTRIESMETMTYGNDVFGDAMQTRTSEYFDGENAYRMREGQGKTFAWKIKPELVQRIGGKALIEQIRRGNKVTIRPDAMHGDRPVFVIEARPAEKVAAFALMTVYIDKQLGSLAKMVMTDSDGRELQTLSFYSPRVNPELEIDRFKFEPPEGVKVVDQTEPRVPVTQPATTQPAP